MKNTARLQKGPCPLRAVITGVFRSLSFNPTNVNDKVRHTGNEEKLQEQSLVQEVAELLAITLAGYRPENSTKKDQEAFVVTIHGTQLHLVTATSTETYLAGRPLIEFFELKSPGDRKEALRMLFGLGKYILSGQAELEQLRHISSKLAEDYR